MKKLIIPAAAAMTLFPAMAQHVNFPSDNLKRGYYDRPYLRYEAEPDFCISASGRFLEPPVPYSQVPLQAEATRLCALSLEAKGDYVEWQCDSEADGVSLRFSLPDSADGGGLTGKLALYAGEEKLADITIDSYWAWQYTAIANTSEKYPDNTPDDSKFARMRFDEVYFRLTRPIAAGERFRIVKDDDTDVPYTIDFVELEKIPAPVTFDDITGEKVLYDGSTALATLINSNPGKTIYIPEGVHNVPRRVIITAQNVKVVGAGMWYTTLMFNTPSESSSSFSQRGFESNASGLVFEGFSMNTKNNKRYYKNNPSYQVGKAFQGSFGNGSTIRNVRADHFECGAWIADYSGTASSGLRVEHCRFRNNYADGFNCCSGTTDAVISHCSFRNNGDDDMAVWSTGKVAARNLYQYNSGECNWRASSCAIYGGDSNAAHNLYIADAMEEGLHVNGEFAGTGFAGTTVVSDVTIERAGDKNGRPGEHGGFWGSNCPALHVRGGYHMAVKDVVVENVDIYDARFRAFGISSNSGKKVENLQIRNLHAENIADNEWLLYVDSSAVGYGSYQNVTGVNCTEPFVGNASNRFTLTDLGSGVEGIADDADATGPFITVDGLTVTVTDLPAGATASLLTPDGLTVVRHDATSRQLCKDVSSAPARISAGTSVSLTAPVPGIYILSTPAASRKIHLK